MFSSQRSGQGAWAPAVRLGAAVPQRYAYNPSVAVNASDAAAAVWYVYDEAGGEEWIEAASGQGSSWSAPVRLSTPGTGVQRYGHVDVAADGHGGFVTVWVQYDELSGLYSLMAEELREGAWQGAQTIASSHERLEDPSVAENAAGEATALWLNYELREIFSASLRGGQWTPQLIEGSTESTFCGLPQPQAGVDAAGVSTATWVNAGGDVFTDTLPNGGVWTGPLRLTNMPEGSLAREPALSENAAGAASLVWSRWNTLENTESTEASYRPAGGSWETPRSLSTTTTEAVMPPDVTIDATGDALTSWGAGAYGSPFDLPYAYVQAPPSPPSAPASPAQSATSDSTPQTTSTSSASGVPGLGPVYLVVAHSRLRLHRHSHTVSATIRNRNAFAVTGTATMSYYLPAASAARVGGGSAERAIATVAHFALAPGASSKISFRLSARALRRLFAFVPDSGHDLVSIRLVIDGPAGQHASGYSVYALDAPPTAHARHHRVPAVPPGYRAPVDPWVKAHAAC